MVKKIKSVFTSSCTSCPLYFGKDKEEKKKKKVINVPDHLDNENENTNLLQEPISNYDSFPDLPVEP